ncbi:hypothetical protein K239x_28730 [Planctomycetes bacterium K23_9]|uniref:Uncharacterized protein n=1 Tax=Stieleria marina TaxID=1930275 RepID=A0A517NUT5_9BACT|nr:hypothetical protein K239x_28730 [Planctomycetes bacterium K23_9]
MSGRQRCIKPSCIHLELHTRLQINAAHRNIEIADLLHQQIEVNVGHMPVHTPYLSNCIIHCSDGD